jgi:Family of unknown function (DUF6505)
MKLLRTIRLDPSDSFVYDRAAAAGEWAVPGGFEFWGTDPATLQGRPRQAFRGGFLGLSSFGWSTLVVAVAITAEERTAAIQALAQYLVQAHGAPDVDSARPAAEEEIAAAISLADHPEGTLIALHRTQDSDGRIREQFRTLRPADAREAARMPCSAGAFAIVEDDAAADPGEDVNLLDLAGTQPGRSPP